jgi:hypothetical protein
LQFCNVRALPASRRHCTFVIVNARWSFLTLALVAACAESGRPPTSPGAVASPALGKVHVFWARGHGPMSPQANPGDTVRWHQGNVLLATKTFAIFWGRDWSDPTFTGDKITGLTSFLEGWNNSHYANIVTEYFGVNGPVTTASTFLGSVIDSSRAPIDAPDITPPAPEVSTVAAEVCRVVDVPDPDAVYMVYATTRITPSTGYCAFHSWGTCGRHPMQFAFFVNMDTVSGCSTGDTFTGHSQGLASLASTTAHELSEAITDARIGTGWWDNNGQEIGDKCAGVYLVSFVTLSNNSIWHVQGEWSNSAFDAGTGQPNQSGELGCLYGR